MTELSKCEKETIATIYGMEYDPALEDVRSAVNAQYHHEWKPQTVSTFVFNGDTDKFNQSALNEILTTSFNGDVDKFKDFMMEFCQNAASIKDERN